MGKGFVIGGVSSGTGKTTIAIALMGALKKRGYTVFPFKAGPDYIDTSHHSFVTGCPSRNLDAWMCGAEYVKGAYYRYAPEWYGRASAFSVIEGVMGLFDGGEASTANLAKLLNLPVVLVINAQSMAQSGAAILKGFETFDLEVNMAGVIFNNIGSAKHYSLIEEAVKHSGSNVALLGYLNKSKGFEIPHRHLGLHMAHEAAINETFIDQLINKVEETVNIDLLIDTVKDTHFDQPYVQETKGPKEKVPVGVARDRAFCFYYEDNLDMLKGGGGELRFFSPLYDKSIPDGVRGLYLGGGYPELYAKGLSENRSMIESIRRFIEGGGVVYAECGGFMYLTRGLTIKDGSFYTMVGAYPVKAKMTDRRVRLGYREIILKDDTIIGERGWKLRGHEYHYSEIEEMPQWVSCVYDSKNQAGGHESSSGFAIGNCLASYVHMHFGYNINALDRFIKKCKGF